MIPTERKDIQGANAFILKHVNKGLFVETVEKEVNEELELYKKILDMPFNHFIMVPLEGGAKLKVRKTFTGNLELTKIESEFTTKARI